MGPRKRSQAAANADDAGVGNGKQQQSHRPALRDAQASKRYLTNTHANVTVVRGGAGTETGVGEITNGAVMIAVLSPFSQASTSLSSMQDGIIGQTRVRAGTVFGEGLGEQVSKFLLFKALAFGCTQSCLFPARLASPGASVLGQRSKRRTTGGVLTVSTPKGRQQAVQKRSICPRSENRARHWRPETAPVCMTAPSQTRMILFSVWWCYTNTSQSQSSQRQTQFPRPHPLQLRFFLPDTPGQLIHAMLPYLGKRGESNVPKDGGGTVLEQGRLRSPRNETLKLSTPLVAAGS